MSTASAAVLFALLSLVFAGLLDVVFKRYSRKRRSRGMFVCGMGLVWGALQLTTLAYQGHGLIPGGPGLTFGLAAGLLVTASNLLLIESLTHLEVSLGSTLYRLNTVGVVILSFFFLAEPLSPAKLSGIAFAIAAAGLLYDWRGRGDHAALASLRLFFWLAVLASTLRAAFGVVTKAGLSAGGDGQTMILLAAACWVAGGLGYAALRERSVSINRETVLYSAICGVIVFLIVNTLFAALARGEATVVVPIANLSFVVALVISVALGMEALTPRKVVALLLAGAAILQLSRVAA